jgi:hypothetical protein
MDEFEIIEDYLKGKLQGTSLKDFENRLVSDSAFASEVEEHRAMHDMLFTQGLMETREKLQTLRKIKQAKEGGKGGAFKGTGLIVIALLVFTSVYVLVVKEKKPENRKAESTPEAITKNEEKIEEKEKQKEEQKQKQSGETGKTDGVMQGQNKDELIDNQITPAPADTHTVKPKDQHPAVDPQINPVIPPEDLCARVTIKAKIITEESCQDQANGTLHITEITGGKRPYVFMLNDMESSRSHMRLAPGKYDIRISDANGCMMETEAMIGSKTCQPEKSNIFAPDYGETWKFPISAGGNCKIRIYDATGNIVYEVNTVNGHPSEWNGVGNNEGYIKAGAYLYQISCDDGAVGQGSVTVTR